MENVFDKIPVEPGSYYVMDKGYFDFRRLYTLIHQCCALFVTKENENLKCEIISSGTPDQSAGMISDPIVKLTGYKCSKSYSERFCLVIYEDYTLGVVYKFIINEFNLTALIIADLLSERWKIELFFYVFNFI